MSTYLTRLAARASGRPAGTLLAPRPSPRIPAAEPVAPAAEPESAARVDPEPEPARKETVIERHAAQAAPGEVTPGPAGASEPATPRAATAAPPVRGALDRRAAGDDPLPTSAEGFVPAKAAKREAPVQARARPRRHEPDPSARQGINGDQSDRVRPIVELRPRPAVAAAVGPRRADAEEPRQPRIEVRIGRVEVRPPRPAPSGPPVQRAPSPPARDPFAGLAAARRYVDRAWS